MSMKLCENGTDLRLCPDGVNLVQCECPDNCADCPTSFTLVVSGHTLATYLNGTFTITQTGDNCSWTYSFYNGINCLAVGRWLLWDADAEIEIEPTDGCPTSGTYHTVAYNGDLITFVLS